MGIPPNKQEEKKDMLTYGGIIVEMKENVSLFLNTSLWRGVTKTTFLARG